MLLYYLQIKRNDKWRRYMSIKIIRHYFHILLVGIVFFLSSVIVHASSEEEQDVIKVGYVWNYGTMSLSSEEDEGYGYEYLHELMQYMDGKYRLEFVECEWDQSLELLESGEIDLFGPVSYTEERSKKFLYTERDFGEEGIYLTALEIDPTNFNEFTEMNNSIVGALEDCAGIYLLDDYFEEYHVDYTIYGTNRINDFEALQYSNIDYYLSSSMQEGEGLKVIAKLGTEPIYYITNQANAEFMDDLNVAMKRLSFEDNLYEEKLYLKYYEEGLNNSIDLTQEQYDSLRNQVYRVGYMEHNAPWTYVDGNEELTGVFIEVIDRIVYESGIEIEYVDMKNLKSTESLDFWLKPELQKGTDITISYEDDFPEEKMESINQLLTHIDKEEKEEMLESHTSFYRSEESIVLKYQELICVAIVCFIILVYVLTNIRKKRQLTKMLDYDELTDVYTKRKFECKVRQILDNNPHKQYVILSIDIDNFKYINELYGYWIGTKVLQIFADYIRLQGSKEMVMGRIISDKFLIFTELERAERAIKESEAHRDKAFEQVSHLLGKKYPIKFSVGVYRVKDFTLDVNYMIDCANIARRGGKQNVGTTINYFTEDKKIERKINNEVMTKMDKALENHDFILYYQPKVDLKTEKLIGAEALIRWVDGGKLVPPNQFIPLFEKNGFVEKVDYYVLEEVCSFLAVNTQKDIPIISVNVSGITILKENVVKKIMNILDKYGINPEQIDLEITESAFVGSFAQAAKQIDILREAGFTISMDDFGAGISSLNRLKEINIDTLKIDRGFIVDTLDNPKGKQIIKSVIEMSKALSIETVAEGIETNEQLEFLEELGCDIGQGYYFSRPLEEEKFIEYVDRRNGYKKNAH